MIRSVIASRVGGGFGVSDVSRQGTPVFNNLPDPVPGNVASLGFQAVATVSSATRSCSKRTRRGARVQRLCSCRVGRCIRITPHCRLPVRASDHAQHLRGCRRRVRACAGASITQTFTIPWRPAADPSCSAQLEVRGRWHLLQRPRFPDRLRPAFAELRSAVAVHLWRRVQHQLFGYQPLGVPDRITR